mgnify:CR=1 FL=1
MGWNKWQKADKLKAAQLVAYKKYFSDQFGTPIDNIDIEFFILKRKVYDHPDYFIPRIQTYVPASGKVKLKKADKALKTLVVMTILLGVMFVPVFQSYKSDEALKIEKLQKEITELKILNETKNLEKAQDFLTNENGQIFVKQEEIKSLPVDMRLVLLTH